MDQAGKEVGNEFGKVVDALHEKRRLSSLRTYQGDMAEFIKTKNESTISIALKEKERKEERQEKEEKLIPAEKPKNTESNFQMNITTILISILLLSLGGAAVMYATKFINREPVAEVVLETNIITYNNLINLVISKGNLGAEMAKISPAEGLSILKISGDAGLPLTSVKDFFNFLNIAPPAALSRTMGEDYVLGVFNQGGQRANFIIITANDFGLAFASMLSWEKSMFQDLSFLNSETVLPVENLTTTASSTAVATSTAATSTNLVKIPLKQEIFGWKDVIVKNKDTRVLINERGKSRLAYTFLDKNTILITNDVAVVGDIYSIFINRAVAR